LLKRVLAVLVVLLVASSVWAATTLNGAGATFPYPIYSKWFSEYHKLHPDVEINYQSIGSGGGIQQLKAGTVDFGASDMPLQADQLKEMRGPIVQLPTVLGAAVPAYNVAGLSGEVKFPAKVLADIFMGKITKWNDKALMAANPGVKLPDKSIVVVHRSDGSGTTFVWTDFLSKVSPEWKSQVGSNTSVKWPVGLGAKGNEGVAGMVRQMDGAIGYVELIYALQNKIEYAQVKNAAGEYVNASLESVSKAAATAQIPADYRVSITNAPGKGVYPISTFTWILVSPALPDAGKKKAIHDFLEWAVTKGQSYSKDLGYAPLPENLVKMELKDIAKLK